jgi:hypothetical protein
MTKDRLNTITQMLPGWNETDQFEEDSEKTAIVQELLTEVERLHTDSGRANS